MHEEYVDVPAIKCLRDGLALVVQLAGQLGDLADGVAVVEDSYCTFIHQKQELLVLAHPVQGDCVPCTALGLQD